MEQNTHLHVTLVADRLLSVQRPSSLKPMTLAGDVHNIKPAVAGYTLGVMTFDSDCALNAIAQSKSYTKGSLACKCYIQSKFSSLYDLIEVIEDTNN